MHQPPLVADGPEEVEQARRSAVQTAAALAPAITGLAWAVRALEESWHSADGVAARGGLKRLAARLQSAEAALRAAGEALEQYHRCLIRAHDEVAALGGRAAAVDAGRPPASGPPADPGRAVDQRAWDSIQAEVVATAVATAAVLRAASAPIRGR